MGTMRRTTDGDELARYLADESRLSGSADEVAWPESPAEAAELLRDAGARGVPVTVSGAGTGIVGGRVPAGGIVLATDRLTRVGEPRPLPGPGPVAAAVAVGAGVPLASLQEAMAAAGFWYPPDPTEAGSFLGGNAATNASGARTFRHGPTRAWVRRLAVVLADGTVLDLPRGRVRARDGAFGIPLPAGGVRRVPAPDWRLPATSKHAAGYWSEPGMDLVDLFIGSEGTLGVITGLELGLLPAPGGWVAGLLFFPGEERALAFVERAREETLGPGPLAALALEFFDGAVLDLLRDRGAGIPRDAAAAIFFEQEVARSGDEEEISGGWIALADEAGALGDSWLAGGPSDLARFREFRHLVPVAINEILARRGVRKVSTDTAVPRGRVGKLLRRVRRILGEEDLESLAFGHVGNDHLHVNILPRDREEEDRARAIYRRLVRAAVELGGTVSAEHGIGKRKLADLELLYPPAVIDRMRAIKRALDPGWILGRGTLLPPPSPPPGGRAPGSPGGGA